MKVIIVGGGKSLYFLCRNFASKGYHVVIINRNREECVQLARRLPGTVICGDGSNPGILEDAGAMEADAVLAMTPNDQDNLVICQLASLKFSVPRAVALANDPDNAEVFEKLGVSSFSTTHIVSNLIEQRTSIAQIVNMLPVGEGRVNVTEVALNIDSQVIGKKLRDIHFPESALVAVVIRDDQPIIPQGESELRVGDRIVLITMPEDHGPVLKLFTGEK